MFWNSAENSGGDRIKFLVLFYKIFVAPPLAEIRGYLYHCTSFFYIIYYISFFINIVCKIFKIKELVKFFFLVKTIKNM